MSNVVENNNQCFSLKSGKICTSPYPTQFYQINNNMASVFGIHLDSRMKLELQVNVLIYGFVIWKLAQSMHINVIIQTYSYTTFKK